MFNRPSRTAEAIHVRSVAMTRVLSNGSSLPVFPVEQPANGTEYATSRNASP